MTPDERRAWLAARQHGIGSSDAPNLVGVGYRTAADVYRQKTEEVPEAAMHPKGVLLRGMMLEPIVAQMYAEKMDVALDKCDMIGHPLRPWQMASPDYQRPDRRRVEMKTCSSWDGYGDDGSDVVPLGYFVQVQHQMGVSGTDFCDLAALNLFGWDLRVFRVPFDPVIYDWLTGVQERFLTEHVLPRVPPPDDWEAQFVEQANALAVKPGTAVDLGAEVAELLAERSALTARIKIDQERADAIRDDVTVRMADAETATAGPFKLKRGFVKGGHVSYDREPRWQLYVREPKAKGKSM